MSDMGARLRRLAGALLDSLLPPRCLGCGVEVGGGGALCGACWRGLDFLAAPWCACCGLPFEVPTPEGTLCGACLASPPAAARVRAALAYDDASRPLLLAFKHADQTHAAPAFAAWMARAAAESLAEVELIAPAPLHPLRLWRRRYNQAALLALELGRLSGVPVATDLLRRTRRTPPQGGLSREGRARNVRGAFALRPAWRDRIAGKRVLLVDDVWTTGATLEACARVLLRAGAAQVDAATLARVVRPGAV